MSKSVVVAAPRGFCAGVDRAIVTVEKTLDLYGPPIYVRKQIVHNRHVVEDLEARGAIFVEELDEVPEGSIVVFSAHGVSPAVHAQAREQSADHRRHLPLVTKVPRASSHRRLEILLIGRRSREVEDHWWAPATSCSSSTPRTWAPSGEDPSKVAWLSQTLWRRRDQETVTLLRGTPS